ncbi:MAG: diguanylate cyclase, partial [Lachnospiraceae bacterium]|nr:diguanylate cyclase [Lachnospiraceae bacterium]
MYSLLYLEVNLFSIVLVIIIAVKTMGMTKMVAQRNFIRGLVCLVIFFISDMVWVLINDGMIPYSKTFLMVVSNVYFIFSALTTYSWFVYFEYLQDSPFVKNRKNLLISAVFVIMQVLIVTINDFTGILYYVNNKREYTRGPLYMFLYAFAYIYVMVTCIRALIGFFKTDRYERRKKLIRLALFPVAPAIGGVVQLFFPKIPIVCAMLALSVMILYLDWLEEMISIDPLTRLNNRKQLTFIYEQWLRNNEDKTPIYLLMIDADHFKEINDTYGHVEGDAALVR